MSQGRGTRVRSGQARRWLSLLAVAAAGCPKGAPMDTDGPEAPTVIEHCGVITDAETWEAGVGHLITCDVVVEGSLIVEPGVEVLAEQGTALRVEGGQLSAVGTSDAPVLFASAEAFPTAGDWVGVVGQGAVVNLAFATLRHAGSEGALLALEGGQASLSNLILSNSTLRGLYASGTEFTVLEELEIAYVDEPLSIPWAAAALLSGVYLDQVDGAAVRLLGDTLDVPVGLGALEVPYLSERLTVVEGGTLWIEEGAMLALADDVVIEAGGAIVMRGTSTATAAVFGWEGASFEIWIDAEAATADFRWASIAGGRVESAVPALTFRYSDIENAPGTALNITGGLDTTVYSQLSGCSFAGEGYGLAVPLAMLPYVGENDYSGSSFDGVVVLDATVTEELNLSVWPPSHVLIQGELRFEGVPVTLTGPATLVFDDGGSLVMDGAAIRAGAMAFTHITETPGGWEGITVSASGGGSWFESCNIAFGGGWDGANVTLEAEGTIVDTTLQDSAGWGVLVQPGVEATLRGNRYLGNARGDVGPGS